MMNEIAALKFLFDKNNFLKYFKYFRKLELEEETSLILETIEKYFKENQEVETIELNDFKVFLNLRNPLAKKKDMVFEVLDSLEKSKVSTKHIEEVILSIIEQHYAAEIIQELTPALDGGTTGTIESTYPILDEYEGSVDHLLKNEDAEEEYVTQDLDALLESEVLGEGLKWRLHCLNNDIGDLRGGSLGHVFARVDTGKTTFLASEVSKFAEQLSDDEVILWFNNEEKGEKVQLRIYSASTDMSKAEIATIRAKAERRYMENKGDRIKVIDQAIISISDIERKLKELNVRLIVIDQGDKVKFKGSSDLAAHERLKEVYRRFRELAKQYNVDILTAGQADNAAEGKKWLRTTNMDNSKVGKPGELDYAIGIGTDYDGPDYARYICVCKNKMKDGNHGRYTVAINVMSARYVDKPIGGSHVPERDNSTPSTVGEVGNAIIPHRQNKIPSSTEAKAA